MSFDVSFAPGTHLQVKNTSAPEVMFTIPNTKITLAAATDWKNPIISSFIGFSILYREISPYPLAECLFVVLSVEP